MVITVASGKGGTGKTTVAVSLAMSLSVRCLVSLDCDVEKPSCYPEAATLLDENAHLCQPQAVVL